jgi:hypothetical protein
VRKLALSDGWQTTAAAVARRVVEDEQEDAVEDEEVVQEEDLSDEEADSVVCSRSSEVEVDSTSAGGTGAKQGRVARRAEEFKSERV